MARTHDPACPADVVVWHGVMASWMAAMLAAPITGRYDAAALAVFAAGAAWAVIRSTAPRSRMAYLRLGICCGAMMAMLAPTATVVASWTDAMAPMSDMRGAATHRTLASAPSGLPAVVTILLVLALLGVAASQASRLRSEPSAHLLTRALEVGTAGAMAVMLGVTL